MPPDGEFGGYVAVVGRVEGDAQQAVVPVARYGPGCEQVERVAPLAWADAGGGGGAIRDGRKVSQSRGTSRPIRAVPAGDERRRAATAPLRAAAARRRRPLLAC